MASLERPIALIGVNPRSIEGSNWWKKTREKVYASTNYHCSCCGVHKSQAKHRQWLEAHESYAIDFRAGIIVLENIWPLCHFCHHFIHRERIKNLYTQGKVSKEYYEAILNHGIQLLNDNDLKLQKTPIHNINWKQWKLHYKDNFYCSKFESEAQKDGYFYWLTQTNQSLTNANLQIFLDIWNQIKDGV